jgi:hypothetical protein
MRRSHELQNTTTGPHITPASKKKNKKTKTINKMRNAVAFIVVVALSPRLS